MWRIQLEIEKTNDKQTVLQRELVFYSINDLLFFGSQKKT